MHAVNADRCEIVVRFGARARKRIVVREPRSEVEARRQRALRDGGAA